MCRPFKTFKYTFLRFAELAALYELDERRITDDMGVGNSECDVLSNETAGQPIVEMKTVTEWALSIFHMFAC